MPGRTAECEHFRGGALNSVKIATLYTHIFSCRDAPQDKTKQFIGLPARVLVVVRVS